MALGSLKCTMALAVLVASHVTALTTRFPAGWNGLAEKPPLAWRSYNAQVAYPGMPMDQTSISQNIDVLTNRSRMVDGTPTSLWDLGYRTAGIDGGWEKCDGKGSMHDAGGNPVVDTTLFPDMAGLVAHGHARGVKMGFYLNTCGCPPQEDNEAWYEGDVRALVRLGFDAVKFDDCGNMRNSTRYAALMNATGKSFLIENCHWGICDTSFNQKDNSGCPTPSRDWCPFNFFRTSGDIRETWNSWTRNLFTATRFLDADAPMSGPHCWAYPDMLQVGNLASPAHDRAHFAAWAIISAPLYLSFDLRDSVRMDSAWPTITNREAIAVNQNWAGHPGRLVRQWTPVTPATQAAGYFAVTADLNDCQRGWEFNAESGHVSLHLKRTAATHGGAASTLCLSAPPAARASALCDMVNTHARSYDASGAYCDDAVVQLRDCDDADPLQRWSFSSSGSDVAGILTINATATGAPLALRADPWWEGAGVQLVDPSKARPVTFSSMSGTLQTGTAFAADTCINASPTMDDAESLMLWAKPQPEGAIAVLVVNNHPTLTFDNATFTLAEVGFGGTAGEAVIRDIWRRADVGHSQDGAVSVAIAARDSRFLLLSPAA